MQSGALGPPPDVTAPPMASWRWARTGLSGRNRGATASIWTVALHIAVTGKDVDRSCAAFADERETSSADMDRSHTESQVLADTRPIWHMD